MRRTYNKYALVNLGPLYGGSQGFRRIGHRQMSALRERESLPQHLSIGIIIPKGE